MVKFFRSRGISIIDLTNLSILIVVFVFYLISIPDNPFVLKAPMVLAAAWLCIWVAVLSRRTSFQNRYIDQIRRFYINFYPLIFLFVLFESFFMILPFFNPKDYDSVLANFDYRLLTVHPTVWVENIFSPLLTDILYLLYLFYFPLPFFILVYLYRKGKFKELDKSVFLLLFVYYGAYIGYFFVPATGPRLYEPIMHLQTKQLTGIFLAGPIRELIAFFEPNKFDAFPSLHTGISLSTLILMAKYNKKMFTIFIPIVAGIWLSLVYCRFHYVADMLAGIVWTVTAFIIGSKIYDRLAPNQLFHYMDRS